jgi:hypothetical protein
MNKYTVYATKEVRYELEMEAESYEAAQEIVQGMDSKDFKKNKHSTFWEIHILDGWGLDDAAMEEDDE